MAEDNPLAADRVFEAAQTTFDSLLLKPKIGKIFESKRMVLKDIRFFQLASIPSILSITERLAMELK